MSMSPQGSQSPGRHHHTADPPRTTRSASQARRPSLDVNASRSSRGIRPSSPGEHGPAQRPPELQGASTVGHTNAVRRRGRKRPRSISKSLVASLSPSCSSRAGAPLSPRPSPPSAAPTPEMGAARRSARVSRQPQVSSPNPKPLQPTNSSPTSDPAAGPRAISSPPSTPGPAPPRSSPRGHVPNRQHSDFAHDPTEGLAGPLASPPGNAHRPGTLQENGRLPQPLVAAPAAQPIPSTPRQATASKARRRSRCRDPPGPLPVGAAQPGT